MLQHKLQHHCFSRGFLRSKAPDLAKIHQQHGNIGAALFVLIILYLYIKQISGNNQNLKINKKYKKSFTEHITSNINILKNPITRSYDFKI